MNRASSPASLTSSIVAPARHLTALAASAGASVLLAMACSGTDLPREEAAPARGGESQGGNPSADPSPAPAPSTGQGSTGGESVPAPPLDGAGASGTGASAGDAAEAATSPDAGVPGGEGIGDAGAPPGDPAPSDPAPDPTTEDPTLDENLAFILEDGFETTYFVSVCRSLGEDGTIIEGTPGSTLPVGGGFILQCEMENLPSRATTDVLSSIDEPWCALGELFTYATGGDERLTVTLLTPPDVSPALLIANSEEPITLAQAAAFGAAIWPLWVVANYDVNEVARAQQGLLCDDIFGL